CRRTTGGFTARRLLAGRRGRARHHAHGPRRGDRARCQGRPIQTFGDKGSVDLVDGLRRPAIPRWVYGNTSPPVVVRDVIVVGSSILDYPVSGGLPPGDVRGFDVRTGRLVWTF